MHNLSTPRRSGRIDCSCGRVDGAAESARKPRPACRVPSICRRIPLAAVVIQQRLGQSDGIAGTARRMVSTVVVRPAAASKPLDQTLLREHRVASTRSSGMLALGQHRVERLRPAARCGESHRTGSRRRNPFRRAARRRCRRRRRPARACRPACSGPPRGRARVPAWSASRSISPVERCAMPR